MAETYNVKKLSEAIALAEKFQSEGKYNLFRGQAQDWEVMPTAGRLAKRKCSESKEKLDRLFYYFSTDNSLKKFCNEVDSFFAIAQHYGLSTSYIDFTTNVNVAFYFATNSKYNKIKENCSIICLNENDFNSFISFSRVLYEKHNVHPPYISKINVDNLWRLQAQSGCFLFTPFHDIEMLYDFDKIIFPFKESFSGIKEQDIFPTRKSEIEILLDCYFDTERRIEGEKRLHQFAKEFNIPITKLPSHNHYKILKKKLIHKSWTSATYKKWRFLLLENWGSLNLLLKIELNIPSKLAPIEQIEYLNCSLKEKFSTRKITKSSQIDFEIYSKPKLSKKKLTRLRKNCLLIWDGTRNLPYTIDDIIKIISTYVILETLKNKFGQTDHTLTGEEAITLVLTNKYGAMTRCKATPTNIALAFRDDINDLIIDDMPRPIPSELLLHINKPRYIFDFHKLLDLFKKEMVAYQVLENSENNNPVIFFTPSQIKTFGYA
jgi:hypothetical protein